MSLRIGHGYDVHAFGPGDAIVIGGATLAHRRGLVAHSDGDVLIHALCDALLGAAGLGDIGRHSPESDPRFRGMESAELFRGGLACLAAGGWHLGTADMTTVARA